MKNIFKYFNITYLALFLIIIWDPLRTYILPEKGSGYIVLLFVLLSLTKEIFNKSILRNAIKAPYIFWLIWIIYALVNTFYINSYMAELAPATFTFSMFLPLFVLLVIANERYDILELTNLFIWAFFFRIMLSLIFDSFDVVRDIVARFGEAFNANNIAFGALFLIVCIGFKKYLTKKINIINYIQIVLALYTIVLTASRKVAIALAIMIIGLIYVERSSEMIKRYVKYMIFALIASFGFIYTLNYTALGQRLIDVYYRTLYASQLETMFDNRLGQYLLGIDLFKMYPINGIGLNNFKYVGNSPVVAHSEYIVQFAECGLIGVFIWLLFYGTIIRRLFETRTISIAHQKISEYFLFFILAMFFLMTGAWVYNMAMYWVVLGLLIKFTEESRYFFSETPRGKPQRIFNNKEGDCIPLTPAPHSSPPLMAGYSAGKFHKPGL